MLLKSSVKSVMIWSAMLLYCICWCWLVHCGLSSPKSTQFSTQKAGPDISDNEPVCGPIHSFSPFMCLPPHMTTAASSRATVTHQGGNERQRDSRNLHSCTASISMFTNVLNLIANCDKNELTWMKRSDTDDISLSLTRTQLNSRKVREHEARGCCFGVTLAGKALS